MISERRIGQIHTWCSIVYLPYACVHLGHFFAKVVFYHVKGVLSKNKTGGE